jgi:hypothetical protein
MNDDDNIADLEDELRQRDRRISELKGELESERDLTHQMAEQIQGYEDTIEAWKHCFEMVPNEAGVWQWSADYTCGVEWFEKYKSLLREWNRFVPQYNAAVRKCTSDVHWRPVTRNAPMFVGCIRPAHRCAISPTRITWALLRFEQSSGRSTARTAAR